MDLVGGAGGGGSGFVCTATSRPSSGYYVDSKYNLSNATTYAGSSSFTSTSGGTETGHSGNGYAKITLVSGTATETVQTTTTVTGIRWNGILRTANFDYGEKYIKETDLKNNVLKHNGINTVTYIEGTGTQWIDTGIQPDTNTRFEMEFALTNITETRAIMGARVAVSQVSMDLFFVNGDLRWDYNKSKTSSSLTYTAGNIIHVEKGIGKIDITSNSKTKTITSSDTISVAKNIYLFNISQGGTAENRFGKFKLYYCKIWQGDTLVRDFVPVIDTEGKACLYDNVSKEYFYNSDSGEFSYQ
jgi:hypothetical protein